MKLTFKVRGTGKRRPNSTLATDTIILQDLKQQKFVIEAEPSETVRDYLDIMEHRWRAHTNGGTEADSGICIGWPSQRKDIQGERLGD